MRRLAVVLVVTALTGVAIAAWGGVASARDAGPASSRPHEAPAAAREHQGAEAVEHRGQVRHAAVRLHRRARARTPASTSRSPAGSRGSRSASRTGSSSSCVTSPAREPALTTDRVDLVIATFTYNTDRDTRIDFSRAYYKATGRILVRNDSNTTLANLAGKTVATTSGSVYERWVKNCHKDTNLIVTDGFTNALLAFRDGRADTLMFDDTILLGIAVTDPARS